MELSQLTSSMVNEIDISFISVLISIVSAAICAYLIKLTYDRYGRSLNNRNNFSNNFVLLCVITALVIIIVKHSLALSLGLVGALSIVRFRAAIKEPEELVYLFLVISLGLCFGANQFLIGYIFTFVCIALIFGFNITSSNREDSNHSGSILIIKTSNTVYNSIKIELKESILSTVKSAMLKSFTSESGNIQITYKIEFSTEELEKNNFLSKLVAMQDIKFELFNDIVIPE